MRPTEMHTYCLHDMTRQPPFRGSIFAAYPTPLSWAHVPAACRPSERCLSGNSRCDARRCEPTAACVREIAIAKHFPWRTPSLVIYNDVPSIHVNPSLGAQSYQTQLAKFSSRLSHLYAYSTNESQIAKWEQWPLEGPNKQAGWRVVVNTRC